ncbi:FliI/YscN family ATPase [Candidatus Puniceispirillum marinum]|uniref:Flagellum-specific ATP synthase n=1 Tax=Puniceispirillum marinum (strain IMCC1322) TaxID=488538 RepID=D5BS25_PUNMI|nr:ATPase, FliI/YscN family [Candidatus Puniceispirillum marinum IMCC1322]
MSILSDAIMTDLNAVKLDQPISLYGHVSRYDGQIIECDGFPANIGSICEVKTDNETPAMAEVIGFNNGNNLLSIYDYGARILVGARVSLVDDGAYIPVGEGLLGRVTDALGVPLDNRPLPPLEGQWPLMGKELNPLQRKPVDKPLDVGVRIINSVLSVGQGQRVGIIAGSGVGKSVLLGMMSRFTDADIVVVGMIGERGREVGSFVNYILGSESRDRAAVVAVPADRSPLLRIRGAERATAIAEYFRDKGKNVLLIMDSLTRVAHARREIGLALGEQPTSKGYPPSVVSMIPRLIERSGTGVEGQGSITAIYTVLADGDDANDPVVDTARAILDGHILLSRQQAQMGIYPAIDVTTSVSRVMNDITDADQQASAARFRRLVSLYMENRDLILMGGYTPGQDPDLDLAVELWPTLTKHIQQPEAEKANFAISRDALIGLMRNA